MFFGILGAMTAVMKCINLRRSMTAPKSGVVYQLKVSIQNKLLVWKVTVAIQRGIVISVSKKWDPSMRANLMSDSEDTQL